MPTLREMFPRKYLSMHDFVEGEMVTVTVKAITLESATIRPATFGRQAAGGMSSPEPKWLIWFHEYPRPMEGRPGRVARMLASVGTDNTDDLIGKRITIYRGKCVIGDDLKEGLLVDDRPAPQLPAAKEKNLLVAKIDGTIPRASIDRAVGHMKAAGKSWDDFLHWCKDKSPEALALAWGVDFDLIPAAIVPAIKAYLDELATPAAPPGPPAPAAAQVIDRPRGPVSPNAPPIRPPPPDIEEADIPF